MQNDILAPAVHLIEEFEGCVLHAYRDPVGIWTIGYGTTRGVRPGEVITKAQAVELMLGDMKLCADAIGKFVTVPLRSNELCALISLSYNIGIGGLHKSTLVRKLNAGSPHIEVADEFLKWVHAGGRVLSGLVRRRRAERELFLHSHALVEEA